MDDIINWKTNIPLNFINASSAGCISLILTISELGSSERISTSGFLKNGVFCDWYMKPINLTQYEIVAFAFFPEPYNEE